MPRKGGLGITKTGTGGYGPLRRSYRIPGENSDHEDWSRDWHPRSRVTHFQDFQQKAASTAPLPWTKAVVGTTPTGDFLGNTAHGVYKLLLTSTDEVQTARIDWADQLLIPATSRWVAQFRIAKKALGATERLAFGLATAYNATLDSVAEHAWVRFEGSDVLKFETDDNTTDSALTTSNPAITNTADAYNLYTIDGWDPANIRFHIDDNDVGGLSAAALTSAMLLQPIVVLQKDSGTGVPYGLIDYIRLEWDRI